MEVCILSMDIHTNICKHNALYVICIVYVFVCFFVTLVWNVCRRFLELNCIVSPCRDVRPTGVHGCVIYTERPSSGLRSITEGAFPPARQDED